MTIVYILIFLVSCLILFCSGRILIESLSRIARFLGWREFVVAFFVMAFASSLPNLFVGITSALRGIPELSFGDVAGNNLAALTLGVALAALFAKGSLPAESRTVQVTSIFTIVAAILPLVLIFDGDLSRVDGVILIGLFVFYVSWLFSKKERFTKIYSAPPEPLIEKFNIFIKDLSKILLGVSLLIISAQGIVLSAQFFAINFNLSIVLVGILITGLGGALPEIYFAVVSAKKGESWMVLGDLMGAVIFPATLVLGIVALICPIRIDDFSAFAVARLFLIIAGISFFFFVRTDSKITKKEAFFLLGIYIIFFLTQVIIK